jgi:hypothetical protein
VEFQFSHQWSQFGGNRPNWSTTDKYHPWLILLPRTISIHKYNIAISTLIILYKDLFDIVGWLRSIIHCSIRYCWLIMYCLWISWVCLNRVPQNFMLNHECPIKVADLGCIPHFQSTQKINYWCISPWYLQHYDCIPLPSGLQPRWPVAKWDDPPSIVTSNLLLILPTDAQCCPDINIKDVVLLNQIGEIAENTAYTQSFLV